jgi:hypothetical protein
VTSGTGQYNVRSRRPVEEAHHHELGRQIPAVKNIGRRLTDHGDCSSNALICLHSALRKPNPTTVDDNIHGASHEHLDTVHYSSMFRIPSYHMKSQVTLPESNIMFALWLD